MCVPLNLAGIQQEVSHNFEHFVHTFLSRLILISFSLPSSITCARTCACVFTFNNPLRARDLFFFPFHLIDRFELPSVCVCVYFSSSFMRERSCFLYLFISPLVDRCAHACFRGYLSYARARIQRTRSSGICCGNLSMLVVDVCICWVPFSRTARARVADRRLRANFECTVIFVQ